MVRVSGALTISTAGALEAPLRPLPRSELSNIVLDLGGVSFIDSIGLRSLVRIANNALRAGGRVRLERASAPVQHAIEWGGLERLLPVAD
jgi:anti-anti-sigma factor